MDSSSLTQRKCQPCEGKTVPLSKTQAQPYLNQVTGWELAFDGKSISRSYLTKDFMAAVALINKVAEVAEDENHHPDIQLYSYRKLRIELSTHAIGGLSENDFIVAAKINELPVEHKLN